MQENTNNSNEFNESRAAGSSAENTEDVIVTDAVAETENADNNVENAVYGVEAQNGSATGTDKGQKKSAKTYKPKALKSIKQKLVSLGLVSIVTTAVLGIAGISSISTYSSKNVVLTDINKVRLLQNDNKALDVSFLYNLDDSDNDSILSNLKEMKSAADDAAKSAGAGMKSKVKDLSANIDSCVSNTDTLVSLMKQRGFKEDAGKYADFVAPDSDINTTIGSLSSESEWVDGDWVEYNLGSLETVDVDGKQYRHISYSADISSVMKRDYMVVRLGNIEIDYQGKVYINNIMFDGSTKLDLSKVTVNDLSKSYGSAYSNLATDTFNGNSSISFDASYTTGNTDWQEASIEIPVSDYDINNYSTVSIDFYVEATQSPVMKATAAFNGKYKFADELENLNKLYNTYSMDVAEGNDVSKSSAAVSDKIKEMSDNCGKYIQDTDMASALKAGITKKSDAFTAGQSTDNQIVQLKSSNNTIYSDMSNQTTDILDTVETQTKNTRVVTMTLIIVIFIVGIVLVVALTLFVILSIQRSVSNFKGTLGKISQGDMTVKAQTGTGDEFDEFGRSLNDMTDKMSDILTSVNDIAVEINQSGGKLEDMAKSTSGTSTQIDVSITEIAQGANDQAEDVEKSTEQIADLGELMDEMVKNVNELDSTSMNMKMASDEAADILDKLSDSNGKMTSGIKNIASQIDKTNDSVLKIREAVSLISSIASQTNLLSLNASIEAARAGDAGKGFAVVASEIQQLADQSDQSADAIYQVISALTSDFQTTMQVMEEVQNATTEQNEKLSETQKQFQIVIEGITQTKNKASIIKDSIAECNKVRNNVSQLMLNLSAISEENASATTETANSMQILNETISELLSASERLMDISKQLEDDMGFFTL